MSADGELTAQIGERLRAELGARGYDVLHDHGEKAEHVGEIISWFGQGAEPTRDTELSQLDIAVIDRESGRTLALIEIEESSDNPKTLLGDVFGTLISEHIGFKDNRPLNVGSWTTLIVLAKGAHAARSKFMQQRVRAVQPILPPTITAFGHLIVESCADESNLDARLHDLVLEALK